MDTQYFVGHGVRHSFGGYIKNIKPVAKEGRFMLFFDVAAHFWDIDVLGRHHGSPRAKEVGVMLRCENEEALMQWATWCAENSLEALVECDGFYMSKGRGKFAPYPVFVVSRFTPMSSYNKPPERVQAFLNAQEGLPANA